jgi:CRISPR/Cas system-associated protein Cas10 (large subunit of type III CRISPR-Cas system)
MMRPKHQYIRSKKLMEAYREIPCQHCGRDDGSVCGAHSNQGAHGKGRSIKASDEFAASLCYVCHSALDQGSHLSRIDRETMWSNAWRKTVNALVKGGLWPADVQIPDIRVMN